MKGRKVHIVVASVLVCFRSAHQMVGLCPEYLDALDMALSCMAMCQFFREQVSLVDSSGGFYVVEFIVLS